MNFHLLIEWNMYKTILKYILKKYYFHYKNSFFFKPEISSEQRYKWNIKPRIQGMKYIGHYSLLIFNIHIFTHDFVFNLNIYSTLLENC